MFFEKSHKKIRIFSLTERLPGGAVPVGKCADAAVRQPAPVTHKIRLNIKQNQIKQIKKTDLYNKIRLNQAKNNRIRLVLVSF